MQLLQKRPFHKLMALMLSVAMVFTMMPLTVSAEAAGCTHEHNETCGYVEGAACARDHDESCGYTDAAACGHQHDEACGEDGADCIHQHDADCGYAEAAPCTHDHNDDCGYIEAVPCGHTHDESCGGLSLGDSGKTLGESGDVVTPTVVFAIEQDEYDTTALYLTESVPVTEEDLLAGVTAVDENGEAVTVTVQNAGGLDPENPQMPDGPPYPPQSYTITYAAEHPVTEEVFTATREAYVTAGAVALAASFDWNSNTPPTLSGDTEYSVTISGTPSGALTVPENATVTIVGEASTSGTEFLTFNIGAGAKVVWNATLSGAGNSSAGLVVLQNSGTFEATGGRIEATGTSCCAVFGTLGFTGNVTVSGGTLSSASGNAIHLQGSADVTVSAGSVTTGSGYAINSTGSGNVTVSGDEVSGSGGILVNTGTATVTAGAVTATGTSDYAVRSNGAILVSGGTVTSSGGVAVYGYVGSTSVVISGGTVSATANNQRAVYCYNGANLIISGGFVFARNSNVIQTQSSQPAFSGATGDGVIAGWNAQAGNTSYIARGTDNLTVQPTDSAWWGLSGSDSGIVYESGSNSGFYPISSVTVSKKTPAISDLSYTIPTGHTYNGSAQGVGNVTSSATGIGSITAKYDGSATAPTNAGTYAVTADIAEGTDYGAAVISLGSYTIAPKSINIASVTALTKIYDGGSATTAAGAVTFNDVVGTLAAGTDYTVNAEFTGGDYNAGGSKPYTYTVTLLNTNHSLAVNTMSGTDGIIYTAGYTYTVATAQNIKVGSGLSAITVALASGTGVENETVVGTLTWYSDSGRTTQAQDASLSSLAVNATITLYWNFTATNTNYNPAAKTGSTMFTIVEGDPQTINFPNSNAAVNKTYGDAIFTHAAILTDGTGTVTYSSSDDTVATVNSSGMVTIHKPGTATITATAATVPGQWAATSAQYTLNVAAKSVTVTAGTYTVSKVYDGTNSAGTPSGSLVTGILSADSGVSVTATPQAYSGTGAGNYTVTVGLALIGDTDNKYTLTNSTVNVPGTITKKPLAGSMIGTIANQPYTGSAINPALTVSDTVMITASDYTVSYSNNTAVGTATATITATAAGNYSGTASKTFNIVKGAAPAATTPGNIMVKADKSGSYNLDKILLDKTGVGTRSYTLGTFTDSNSILTATPTLIGNVVNFTGASGATVGHTATLVVTIATTNFEDCTVTLTFEVTDMALVTLGGVSVANKTYGETVATLGTLTATDDDGLTVAISNIATTYTYTGNLNIGVAYNSTTPPTEAGDYKLTITGTGTNMIVTPLEIPFTINKKTVTVTGVNQSVTVGTAPAAFTATIAGEVSGKPLTNRVTTAYCPTYVDAVGTYPIIPDSSSDTSGNYNIVYVNGALTVSAASVVQHTLTATAGTGGSISPSGSVTVNNGASQTFTISANSGYSISDVKVDGTSVGARSSYTFSNVTGNHSIYATFYYSGTGGGSSSGGSSGGGSSDSSTSSSNWTVSVGKQPDMPTTATVSVSGTVDKNGVLSFTVTDAMMKDAIEKAQAEAKRLGKTTDGIVVEIKATTTTGAKSLTAKIDAAALSRLNTAGAGVSVNSSIFRFTLDDKAVKEVKTQTTGTVTFTATPVTMLSNAATAAIGNRPVFDFTVKDGAGKTITSYGSGTVTRGIKYSAASGEKSGSLFIVKIVDGKVQWIDKSSYDSGWMIWSGDSNSVYGVGYKTTAPAFTDTTSHWAKDDIDFVASRDLISGTSATTFSPNTAITRADFLMALGKLSGADVSGYTASSFTDVANTNPAMPYIEWAVKNKIVQGIGDNKFGPDQQITREQMAAMMVNYAKATGYTLPVSRQAVTFADDAKISSYAKDAVKAIQQTGVISGKPNNLFDPQGNATRAEASAILRRFVELVIDEGTARGWVHNDAGQMQYINTNGKAVTGWLDTTNGNKWVFRENGPCVRRKRSTHPAKMVQHSAGAVHIQRTA